MKKILLISIAFFFISCSHPSNNTSINYEQTVIKNLTLNQIKKGIKSWQLNCKVALIDEAKNILNCKKTYIKIFKNSDVVSEITAETGIYNINQNRSQIDKNVVVNSYTENSILYTDKIYFDSNREVIYTDKTSKLIRDDVEIISEGFEAKADLSNIKFYKHTTRKIKVKS